MLTVFPKGPRDGGPHPVWFDLCEPTEAELHEVEARTGVKLPRRDDLSEIERSSRLQRSGGVLTMSTPTAVHRTQEDPTGSPLGFVLARDWLITIRFTRLAAFETVAHQLATDAAPDGGGPAVFTSLCEEIVGQLADGLEHTAAKLGTLSMATFHGEDQTARQVAKYNRQLREQIRQVGRLGDRLSGVRDSILGLSRILAFAEQYGCPATAVDLKERLTSVRQDLVSLSDYDEHLAGKVQFVLDAQVGLIGIAQNDIFKVLTILSTIGIAPTLIAGIYGMNFKIMPELNWAFGYPYSLALMALSVVVPLVWFKVKGWF